MNKRQAILDRIHRCGRLGKEHKARRLYLTHGIGFRAYRSAYEAGRQEARKMRIIQKSTKTVARPPNLYDTFIFNGTFVNAEWDRFVEEQSRGLP